MKADVLRHKFVELGLVWKFRSLVLSSHLSQTALFINLKKIEYSALERLQAPFEQAFLFFFDYAISFFINIHDLIVLPLVHQNLAL